MHDPLHMRHLYSYILQKLIVNLLNEKVQIYEKCCHVFALVVDVPIFGKATVGEVMNLSALPMAGNLQPVPQSYLVSMLNSFRNVLQKGPPMQRRRPYNHYNSRYGASFLLHWLINVQNCTNFQKVPTEQLSYSWFLVFTKYFVLFFAPWDDSSLRPSPFGGSPK